MAFNEYISLIIPNESFCSPQQICIPRLTLRITEVVDFLLKIECEKSRQEKVN
jgi:hypothetical protein